MVPRPDDENYKAPDGDTSRKLTLAVADGGGTFGAASVDFRFAAAVAAFGMILRDSPHKGTANYRAVLEHAQGAMGEDRRGYRREFVDRVARASRIQALRLLVADPRQDHRVAARVLPVPAVVVRDSVDLVAEELHVLEGL